MYCKPKNNVLFITLCYTVVNVRFVQPEYTFNEASGRATVCLTKDLETGVNFTVFVFTINGSAVGEHKHAQCATLLYQEY